MLKFDLRWHLGHVYALLVIARRIGRRKGMSDAAVLHMLDDMRAGDYHHLLSALERRLPNTFEFLGDPRQGEKALQTPIDPTAPAELKDLMHADGMANEINAMNAAGLLRWPNNRSASHT